MALMFLAGAAIPIIHYLDNKNNGIGWTPDSSFFSYGLLTPVLLAVLTAFFVGTEYSDGTMRNKLIAGHGRRDIYLANLVVCIAAGMLLSLAYLTPHTCLGIPLLGAVQTDFPTLVLYMGLNGALIAAFAANLYIACNVVPEQGIYGGRLHSFGVRTPVHGCSYCFRSE